MDFGLFSDALGPCERFRELLRTCPLVVLVRDDRILIRAVRRAADGRLVEDFSWPLKHWDQFCAACDLFWSCDEVFDWCASHPHAEDGIHYQNVDALERMPGMPRLDVPESLSGESDACVSCFKGLNR